MERQFKMNKEWNNCGDADRRNERRKGSQMDKDLDFLTN